MQTGQESGCRAILKSCDKIPPFVLQTDEENFASVCKNPTVIETDFNQYFENEGRSTYI